MIAFHEVLRLVKIVGPPAAVLVALAIVLMVCFMPSRSDDNEEE